LSDRQRPLRNFQGNTGQCGFTIGGHAFEFVCEIPLPAEPLPELTPSRATIERAVKVFLDELRESIAPATHKKYRLLLTKFKEFSTACGYVMIDQWDPTDNTRQQPCRLRQPC